MVEVLDGFPMNPPLPRETRGVAYAWLAFATVEDFREEHAVKKIGKAHKQRDQTEIEGKSSG
ncbi:MAG: hypothetical protein FLDDKLPJ_03659 [Phycisphaerae bacterium]|nr:hypothetical protein [Phycisphaerae bacterium]